MHKLSVLAFVVAAGACSANLASAAESRNQPKCDFHVFTDVNDHWPLAEGSPKRKWLVMNVGDAAVLVSGSVITTPGHPDHEELIGSGQSTIAVMKFGQPAIRLVSAEPSPGAATPQAQSTNAGAAMQPSDSALSANSAPSDGGMSSGQSMAGTTTANAPETMGGGSSSGNAAMMASGKMPAGDAMMGANKTTVVICRFFERR